MADHIIEIPGVGTVAFPADMNEDALRAAAQQAYRQGQERASRAASGLGEPGETPWGKLAAVAGAPALAAGIGAAAPALAALAPGIGRLLTSPAMRAAALGAAGEYIGRKIGGTPGAILGGTLGGGAGLRGLQGVLRAGVPAATGGATRPAADALATMGRNLILSPADAARKGQLIELARQEAKEAGTVAAGRAVRSGPSLIEQLFGQ